MSGCVASTSAITRAPPPFGMCTSTSTTSGARSRIISIAASTSDALPTTSTSVAELGAHAGEEQLMVVDEEHPRRAHAVTPSVASRQRQLDLGALARRAAHLAVAAGAREPADDRARDPAAVGGHRDRVEAAARGRARRSMTRLRLDLEVHRHARRAGVAHRVDDRLARGQEQRLQPGGRAVADPHDLDRHAVLASRRRPPARRARRRASRRTADRRDSCRRREQPAAQLAFLHAREPHDLARIVGAALHERERLEHGIVQVRGDLGALVGTDPLPPLADELVHQRPQPGSDDQARTRRAPPRRR